jgi:hypothetical protein
MTDSSQQLEASREDFQAVASRVEDFQEEVSRVEDFQEEVSRVEVFQVAAFQEEVFLVGVTTFRVADSQEEAVEVTNMVHHQAHRLHTHRNKVFPLLRLTLVPLEDADSASRIFG